MARFSEVFKNRDFFLLWLGQIISQFGDRLNQMALIGLIYQRSPGSTWEMAKLFSFIILPVFLLGPIAGVYVDRWDRRRTMLICDLLRGVLVLSIPLVLFRLKVLFPIYLIVFLAFCVARFFVPAKMAIIPNLVSGEHLLLANSLVSTTGMVAAILGFGLGGILVSELGVEGGFYLDSLTFFISGILIFFISLRSVSKRESIVQFGRKIVDIIKKSKIREFCDGIRYLMRVKNIRFVGGTLFFLGGALGCVYVVSVVFVQESLGSITKDLGLLAMFLGAGLFIGSLAYGRFGQRFSRSKTILLSLTLSGLLLAGFAFALKLFPSFTLAAAISLLLGLSISPVIIASNTLLHQVSRDEMRGRIFSSLEVVMHFAFLLFMFIGASLAEVMGKMPILLLTGGGLVFVSLIGWIKRVDLV